MVRVALILEVDKLISGRGFVQVDDGCQPRLNEDFAVLVLWLPPDAEVHALRDGAAANHASAAGRRDYEYDCDGDVDDDLVPHGPHGPHMVQAKPYK